MTISLINKDQFWSDINCFAELGIDEVKKYLDPKFRSSAIFPVYKKNGSHCYLSFLTYWLKKNGSRVAIILTARNVNGEIVGQEWMPITRYYAFNYDVSKFEYFPVSEYGFCGSIEVEVFSPKVPAYTFPAISLFYENNISSSVVHSCIRTYNIKEINSDYAIDFPQTGFDVVLEDDKKNYICFYGGSKSHYKISLSLELHDKTITKNLEILNQRYSQQHLIILENLYDLKHENLTTKVTINHNLDVFPRFYVGIIQENKVPTLTHTFFDTSEVNVSKRNINHIGLRSQNIDAIKYFDSAFFIPLLNFRNFNTTLRTYGQNLEFNGDISFKVYTSDGELIHQKILSDEESGYFNENYSFNISKECKDLNLNPSTHYNIFIGFNGIKTSFPKRFKMGLNVRKKFSELGTNICFAPLVQVDGTLDKPLTRRWFPIGGPSKIIGTIHLTNFEKHPIRKSTEISIEFIKTNGETLIREATLFFNQSILIDCNEDLELELFLNGELGWCFVTASTYCIDSYYFSTEYDQIGGDHAF